MIRYNPNIKEGLTDKQVLSRIKKGYVNYDCNVKTKSIGQIILSNTFTLFNILNLQNMPLHLANRYIQG